jgi:hypothetical protein
VSAIFKKVSYLELNSRQQEAYNFQLVSAVLAEFGFTTIRLTSDWNSADFIAQHFDGTTFLKVQLKGRLSFYKKYQGRDLHICFRHKDVWYLYPHDQLLDQLLSAGYFAGTESWERSGGYNIGKLSPKLREALNPYRLTA